MKLSTLIGCPDGKVTYTEYRTVRQHVETLPDGTRVLRVTIAPCEPEVIDWFEADQ